MKRFIWRISFLVLIIGIGLGIECDIVLADTYDNAIDYYGSYGNNAIFKPTTKTNGYIYCATVGNSSKASVKYKTIGWKMKFIGENGKQIDVVYYKLGGSYLTLIDSRIKGGYEYDLYSISLYTVKQRLSKKALELLNKGKCSISMDACMVVERKGVPGGSINDSGKTTGEVYTTYEGISNAAGWSDAALVTLKTYFGKKVNGLFFNITVKKTAGVKKVTGGGKYCYGTYVTILAELSKNYIFDRWKGKKNIYKQEYSFYVSEKATWTAYATAKSLDITFFRNSTEEDMLFEHQTFIYPASGESFIKTYWTKKGYHLVGWALSPKAQEADYSIGYTPSSGWISKNMPELSLYGVWEPNTYTVKYEGRLEKNIKTQSVQYGDSLKLPNNGKFSGWSLYPFAVEPEYKAGQVVKVNDVLKILELEDAITGTIVFNAIWKGEPSIDASDMFYSLDFANYGGVTEAELASHARALDSLDGIIQYGNNADNSFIITNYDGKAFKELREEADIPINFEVINSLGVKMDKTVIVHVVDSTVRQDGDGFGRIRFISEKYLERNEKAGGLIENSCWKLQSYYNLLKKALSYSADS